MTAVSDRYTLADPTRAFLDRPMRMLIGGERVAAASGKTFETLDPATGSAIVDVPAGDAADIGAAVAAARAAFPKYAGLAPSVRQRLLLTLATLVEREAETFAQLESLDNGKAVGMARAVDVNAAIEYLRYTAGWATKIEGVTVQPTSPPPRNAEYVAYTLREPVGVVGAIVPWNFPLLMAVWKIAPALAAGCTVVLKPAEETPLTALLLGELALEAGFAAGVVNVVTGDGATAGAALAAHPGIDKITFTGSTEVGKLVGKAAMDNLTRVTLELGGKSPVVILKDAPVDKVGMGAAQAIFFNSGQVCTAGSRIIAHRSIVDQVIEKMAGVAQKMKIGPGLDPSTVVGPLVSQRQFDRVSGYVAAGLAGGATAAVGGERVGTAGYFMQPTVLVGAKPDSTVVQEEIFGPVAVVLPFDDVDEAAALANDTPYGLAASVWSNDLSATHRLVKRIKAGTVWVNNHNQIDPALPFGGYKQSGLGREHGHAAIDIYTEQKTVWMTV
jgi:phenylacetaldehyde dehydrogenase